MTGSVHLCVCVCVSLRKFNYRIQTRELAQQARIDCYNTVYNTVYNTEKPALTSALHSIIYGKRLLDHERYAKRTSTYGSVHGAALRKGSLRTAANLRCRNRATGRPVTLLGELFDPPMSLRWVSSTATSALSIGWLQGKHADGLKTLEPHANERPARPRDAKATLRVSCKQALLADSRSSSGAIFDGQAVRYLMLERCDI